MAGFDKGVSTGWNGGRAVHTADLDVMRILDRGWEEKRTTREAAKFVARESCSQNVATIGSEKFIGDLYL